MGKTPLGVNNTNISSNGSQAINDANTILWDSQWVDILNKIEKDSQQYTHDCGTVFGNANKSKDSAAVDKLNSLKDYANRIKNKSIDFTKSIYYNSNNSSYIERMRMINSMGVTTNQFMDIKGSHIFLIPSEVESRTTSEKQRTSDIAGKIDTEKNRGEKEKKRGEELDASQATIRKEFETKKKDLNSRIDVLNNKISDARRVKNDRNNKKNKLVNLQQKSETQNKLSNAVSTSLLSALEVNKNQLKQLTDRVTTTQNNAVDSYEEYYKAIILQNNLLETAKSEMDNNISTSQRKSEFVLNKKTFVYDIYIKLFVFYYIFIIFFIGLLFVYKKFWSIYYKIALIIIGIFYPFIILTVESWLYNSWLYVLSLLTGSVYVYRPL